MSLVAITAIVVGLLLICLALVILAGAINEIARRRMVEEKKKAAGLR